MPTTTIYTPDGLNIDVIHPEGAADQDIISYGQQMYAQNPSIAYDPNKADEPPEDNTTLGGQLYEAAKGIPRGFASSFLMAGEGLTELADAATNALGYEDLIDSGDENELVKLFRAGREGVKRAIPLDPAYQDKFIPMVGEGLGSLGAFLIPGLAGGKLAGMAGLTAKGVQATEIGGSLALGVGMGAGEQAERIQTQRDAGTEIDELTEDKSIGMGGAIGATELIPIFHFLKGVPATKESVAGARGALVKIRDFLASRDITTKSGAKAMARTGGEEAVQEGLAGLLQDFVEKYEYNPDLEVGQSVVQDAEVGGAVGAISEFLFRSMSGRRRNVFTEEQRQQEEVKTKQIQDDYAVRKQVMDEDAATRAAGLAAVTPPAPEEFVPTAATPDEQAREFVSAMGSSFPLNTYFRAEGNTVVSREGQQFGPMLGNTDSAAELAASLNRQVVVGNTMDLIDTAIDQSDSTYTPEQTETLRAIGASFMTPARQMVTADQIAMAEDDVNFGGERSETGFLSGNEALQAGVPMNQMTPLQRFQAKRIRAGEQPLAEFTPAQAKKLLGDNFGRLVDVRAGLPLTYMATTQNGEIVVKDTENVGEPLGPFNTLREAQAERDRLNAEKGYSAGVTPEMFEEAQFGIDKVKEVLEQKNITDDINSPALRTLAEAVTGRKARGNTRIPGFSPGELRVLYHQLRTLPRFDSPTALPNFNVKQRPQAVQSDAVSTPIDEAPLALPGPPSVNQDIAKAVRQAMKGFGLERVGTNIVNRVGAVESDTAGNLTYGARVQDGQVVEGELAPIESEGMYAPWLDQIFIGLDNIRSRAYESGPIQPGQELTNEQITEAALDVLNHEILHALREADLFTQREWEILVNAASNTTMPDSNLTYFDETSGNTYKDSDISVQMEEAVANLTRDVLRGRKKLAGKPRSLIRRIVEFIKRMFKVTNKAGYDSPGEIIEAIREGAIAGREQGVVRSMLRQEREAARNLQGYTAPVAALMGVDAPETREADFIEPIEQEAMMSRRSGIDLLYSPAMKAVETMKLQTFTPSKKNPDGRAPGNEIWKKLIKTPGVKKDELFWTGLEEYLTDGDNRFTRDEVVNFLERGGIKLQETYADKSAEDITQGSRDLNFLPVSVDPADYKHLAAMNGGQFDVWISMADPEMKLHIVKSASQYDPSRFAFTVWHGDPEFIGDKSQATTMTQTAAGDATGYRLPEVMEFWSLSEAEVYAKEMAEDFDILSNDSDSNEVPQWDRYVMDGVHDKYREIKLRLPNDFADEVYKNDTHFEDDNIIAFARVSERNLLGKDALFIEEAQSDWHSDGRKMGYKEGLEPLELVQLDQDTQELVKKATASYKAGWEKIPASAKEVYTFAGPLKEDPVYLYTAVRNLLVDSNRIRDRDMLIAASENPELEESVDMFKEAARLSNLIDRENFNPHKAPWSGDAWLALTMKRAIIDAVAAGKSHVAWPNSYTVQQTWGDSFDYAPQYDRKMVSIAKKLGLGEPMQMTQSNMPWDAANPTEIPDNFRIVTKPATLGRAGEYYQAERRITVPGRPDEWQPSSEAYETREALEDYLLGRIGEKPGYWVSEIAQPDAVRENGFPMFSRRARWQEGLARAAVKASEGNPSYMIAVEAPEKYIDSRIMKQYTISSGTLRGVLEKHGQEIVPAMNDLPDLLDKATLMYRHKEGGVTIVLPAKSASGKFIVVGTKGGEISTVHTKDNPEALKANLQGKRVEFKQRKAGDPAAQFSKRKRVGTTGQYVGAVKGIDTPSKLNTMLNKVQALAEEGEYGRFWYERSSKQIMEMVGNDKKEAEKLVQAIAVTSQGTPVGMNFSYALQAYMQHKAGKPILTGRFPEKMSEKLTDIFNGKSWEGRKTNSFYLNLMAEIDPSVMGQEVTHDLWMMRAFGHYQDNPTNAQYEFSERETQLIAKKLGWEPHQVQAAVWVALKSRMENRDVVDLTEKISVRNKWMRYNASGDRVILNEEKHRKNWFRQALKHNPTGKDKEKAKFDYKDAALANATQLSWETRPGTTTGGHMFGIGEASQEQLLEYHYEMSKAFVDDNGRSIIEKELGIPSIGDFDAPGYWTDGSNPSTQTLLVTPSKYGTSPSANQFDVEGAAFELINAAAAIRGMLLKQDAVAWHKPFFTSKLAGMKRSKHANGVEVNIGRSLSATETLEIGKIMEAVSGGTWFAPIASPNGVRFINFDKTEVDNNQFQKYVKSTLEQMQFDNNEDFVASLFGHKNDYLENNWQENPNGEGYLAHSAGGRPDLQKRIGRILSILRPRVDAVEQEFADRYGWTRNPEIRAGRDDGLGKLSVRPSGGIQTGRNTQGVTLGSAQPAGQSFAGVHYGREETDELQGAKYGTGIRGAEAKRLRTAEDERIKNRVYFYIENNDGELKRPEPGLGQHVYSQKFNNILPNTSEAAKELLRRTRTAPDPQSAFETAVINAGYDGYAVPKMGMMVILNHDAPVNYLGERQALSAQGFGHMDMLDVDPVNSEKLSELRSHDPAQVASSVAANKSEIDATLKSQVPYFTGRGTDEAQHVARNPDVGRKLTPEQKEMYSQRSQPNYSPRMAELVNNVTATRPRPKSQFEVIQEVTELGPIKSRLMRFRQEALQRYGRLEQLNNDIPSLNHLADSSSIAAALFADRSRGVLAAAIQYGVPVYKNGLTKVQRVFINDTTGAIRTVDVDSSITPEEGERDLGGLIGLMQQLKHPEFGDLTKVAQAYAISRRSERIDAEGNPVPINQQERAALEQEIDNEYGAGPDNPIRKWHREWQSYNEFTIDFMKDTGVLSEETAQLWRDHADYYPFYRAAEENEGMNTPALSQQVFGSMTGATQIRELKGSEAPLNMEMIEAISLNLTAAIDMGMKNVAQQRIVRDMIKVGLAVKAGPNSGSTAPVVKFRVNGKKREFHIKDPLIFESMKALDGDGTIAMVRSTFGKASTLLRETITRDPGFMAVNMLRDTMSAWVTSGSDFTPVIDTLKGFGQGMEKLESYGVVGGYDYSNDPDDSEKYFRKKEKERTGDYTVTDQFVRLWDGLGQYTTKSDAATRNAVYEDVLARTGNEAEAAFQAMEVINFSRRGRSVWARALTTAIPFLNARFQGLDVMIRGATGKYSANSGLSAGEKMAAFYTRAAIMVGISSMYWLLVSDDDDYQQLTDVEKDMNWFVPVAKDVSFKIPIPFEVGLLFKTIPETILDTTFGDRTTKEAAGTLGRGVVSTFEVNPLGAALIAPMAEAMLNHNFFTGREIVPYYVGTNVVSGLQERVGTNELAKNIGHALNISPMKVEHVMTGYTGTIGSYVWDLADVTLRAASGDDGKIMPSRRWYDYPLIKRFFQGGEGAGIREDAYDLYFTINKLNGTINNLVADGRIDEAQRFLRGREDQLALLPAAKEMKNILSDTNKQKEAIKRSKNYTADEKREMIERIDRQLNDMLTEPTVRLKNRANLPVDAPIIGSVFND